jgi:hypothetical protein
MKGGGLRRSRGSGFRAANPSGKDRGRGGAGARRPGVTGPAPRRALLAHHRGWWWTASGTLSQCPSQLRLPLTSSFPLKRPSEKPHIERVGSPLTYYLPRGQSLKTARLDGGKRPNQRDSKAWLGPGPKTDHMRSPRRGNKRRAGA